MKTYTMTYDDGYVLTSAQLSDHMFYCMTSDNIRYIIDSEDQLKKKMAYLKKLHGSYTETESEKQIFNAKDKRRGLTNAERLTLGHDSWRLLETTSYYMRWTDIQGKLLLAMVEQYGKRVTPFMIHLGTPNDIKVETFVDTFRIYRKSKVVIAFGWTVNVNGGHANAIFGDLNDGICYLFEPHGDVSFETKGSRDRHLKFFWMNFIEAVKQAKELGYITAHFDFYDNAANHPKRTSLSNATEKDIFSEYEDIDYNDYDFNNSKNIKDLPVSQLSVQPRPILRHIYWDLGPQIVQQEGFKKYDITIDGLCATWSMLVIQRFLEWNPRLDSNNVKQLFHNIGSATFSQSRNIDGLLRNNIKHLIDFCRKILPLLSQILWGINMIPHNAQKSEKLAKLLGNTVITRPMNPISNYPEAIIIDKKGVAMHSVKSNVRNKTPIVNVAANATKRNQISNN